MKIGIITSILLWASSLSAMAASDPSLSIFSCKVINDGSAADPTSQITYKFLYVVGTFEDIVALSVGEEVTLKLAVELQRKDFELPAMTLIDGVKAKRDQAKNLVLDNIGNEKQEWRIPYSITPQNVIVKSAGEQLDLFCSLSSEVVNFGIGE
jgi:hypothetical protein